MGSYKIIISNGRINSWVVICFIFLFPIVALINYLFDIKSGMLSGGYRLFNLVLSILIIGQVIVNTINNKKIETNISFLILLAFWLLFITRLIIDIEVYDLYLITSYAKSYYYLYTLCVTFIPMIALSFLKPIDFNYLIKDLKNILFFFNLAITALYFYQLLLGSGAIFRFYLTRGNVDFLNPITIGIYASFLILLSLFSKQRKPIDFLFMVIGSINLIAAGSRGPLLFTLIVISIALAYNFKLFFKNHTDFLLKFCLLSSALIVFLFFFNSIIFQRLFNFASDDSSLIRKSILNEAMNQFMSNPIFGSHFLVVNSKSYSHNIFLDILLANGVLGILVISPVIIGLFWIFIKNKFKSIFLLIVLLLFLCSNTSGSIYNSYEFWLTFAVVLANQSQFINAKINN